MGSRCAVGFSGYREAGGESLGQRLHDGPVTANKRVHIILRHLYAIIRVGYVYNIRPMSYFKSKRKSHLITFE